MAKIDEYARRLRDSNYDKWGTAGDLAFLIHFVGDIHQPLHTTANADRGGTCQQVDVTPAEETLHYAWDDAVVTVLEKQLGTNEPEATAWKLEALSPPAGELVTWKPDEQNKSRGSHIDWPRPRFIVRSGFWTVQSTFLRSCYKLTCDHESGVHGHGEVQVAGRQLAKAGYRLAALLNQLWLSKNTKPEGLFGSSGRLYSFSG